MAEPGGGRTAHIDTFVRDNLPPRELWPDLDFGGVPELAAYPNRFNAAARLIDRAYEAYLHDGRPHGAWFWADLQPLGRIGLERLFLTASQNKFIRHIERCHNGDTIDAGDLATVSDFSHALIKQLC